MEFQEVEPPDDVITSVSDHRGISRFRSMLKTMYGKHILVEQLVRALNLLQLGPQLSSRALLEKLPSPQEWSTPQHQSSQFP